MRNERKKNRCRNGNEPLKGARLVFLKSQYRMQRKGANKGSPCSDRTEKLKPGSSSMLFKSPSFYTVEGRKIKATKAGI